MSKFSQPLRPTTLDVIACLLTFSVTSTCGCYAILNIQFMFSKGDGTGVFIAQKH